MLKIGAAHLFEMWEQTYYHTQPGNLYLRPYFLWVVHLTEENYLTQWMLYHMT